MKRFSEQFYIKASTVKLRASEQRELRTRVVSYMEYHPAESFATKKTIKNSDSKTISFPGYNMVQIPFSIVMKWSGVAAAFLLIVVPMLAERTVPGDSLYAVKVRFTEEMRSTLTLTPYGKVEWETERINRRIAEARLLANEGKLTDEAEAEIAAAVKEHAEMAQSGIEEMRRNDVDEATLASIELSTTLELQSASLQEEGSTTLSLAMNDVTAENPAQMVVDVINDSLSAHESQVESADIPAYDKIMARVEINTTRAYELLNATKLAPEDQLHSDLSRRLDDINRSIEQAQGMRTDNEGVASQRLVDVLQRTQKLVVYMSDIEANRSIALEGVVPVILTEEEQKKELALVSAEVHRKQEIITTVLPKLSASVAEKARYSLDVTVGNDATIASSSEVAGTLKLAKESDAVLTDILTLVKADGVDIMAATPVVVSTDNAASTTESILPADDAATGPVEN